LTVHQKWKEISIICAYKEKS